MSEPLEAKGTSGTVRFDGHAIEIERKGFRARATVGKGTKHIPLASVTAVQFKPAGAMVNGFIQFTVPGGNEVRSKYGKQTTDAVKDENAVVFHRKQREAFEKLRDAVQDALAERHRAPSASVTAPDIPGQIKQLAELRDSGILSADEFEAKKSDLLGRL